ncbi:MAG: ExbD/TolR family protein [Bacteriovoracaceae bacterium]
MIRAPSSRKEKKTVKKLNLIPILDSVFIFIFFLLMSTNFIEIFEIQSNVPIISNKPVKSKDKPLGLLVQVLTDEIRLFSGVPAKLIQSYGKLPSGDYDLEKLHDRLVVLKQKYITEKTIMLEPLVDISYQDIVKIMDSLRTMKTTDPTLFIKDKDNLDVKVRELFPDIIFTNIRS